MPLQVWLLPNFGIGEVTENNEKKMLHINKLVH